MTFILIILVVFFVLWLIAQAGKGLPQKLPKQRRNNPKSRTQTVDEVLESLHSEGVTLGYTRAWEHQLELEKVRVKRYFKARASMAFLHTAIGVLLALLPLTAATGALPLLSNAAPNVVEWQWVAIALITFIGYRFLALAIALPRDYMKFLSSSAELEPQFERLATDVKHAVATQQVEQLLEAQVRLRNEVAAQYEAGEEKGRREGLEAGREAGLAEARESAAASLAEAVAAAERRGRIEGVEAAEEYYKPGLEEEWRKGYEKGAEAGRAATRLEAQSLLSDAYSKGRLDGETDALAGLHQRLRTERAAGYQLGYSDGHTEGYHEGLDEGRRQGKASSPRSRSTFAFATSPTTRVEALELLQLTANASETQIDEQFRKLRAAIHPDIVRGRKLPPIMVKYAEEHFKLLGEAYDLLTGVRA